MKFCGGVVIVVSTFDLGCPEILLYKTCLFMWSLWSVHRREGVVMFICVECRHYLAFLLEFIYRFSLYLVLAWCVGPD